MSFKTIPISMKILFGLAGLVIVLAPWEFMGVPSPFSWGIRVLGATAVWGGWAKLQSNQESTSPLEAELDKPIGLNRVGFFVMAVCLAVGAVAMALMTLYAIKNGRLS